MYVMETGVTPSLDWDEQVARYTEQFGVSIGRPLQFSDSVATRAGSRRCSASSQVTSCLWMQATTRQMPGSPGAPDTAYP